MKARKWTYPVLFTLILIWIAVELLVYAGRSTLVSFYAFFDVLCLYLPLLALVMSAKNRKRPTRIMGTLSLLHPIFFLAYLWVVGYRPLLNLEFTLVFLLERVLPVVLVELSLFGVTKQKKYLAFLLFFSSIALFFSSIALFAENCFLSASYVSRLKTYFAAISSSLPHSILGVAILCPFQFSQKRESTESDSYLESYKKQHHY